MAENMFDAETARRLRAAGFTPYGNWSGACGHQWSRDILEPGGRKVGIRVFSDEQALKVVECEEAERA